MNLPESILLCLFPNGVFLDESGQVITNLTENDIVFIDFSPRSFKYIIDSFAKASASMPQSQADSQVNDFEEDDDVSRLYEMSVLKTKPCIIVLREDLDFYCITPTPGLTSKQMKKIKLAAAKELVSHTQIFEGLGYGSNKTFGPAEQHLLDMLCNAGYTTDDVWGSRELEPGKAVISSLALVQLQQGDGDANSDTNNSNNKLLLFWKKPARKCWWSKDEVTVVVPDLMNDHNNANVTVKVHIRRVWTLELAILSFH